MVQFVAGPAPFGREVVEIRFDIGRLRPQLPQPLPPARNCVNWGWLEKGVEKSFSIFSR
ncbi:MAG: hypothetical protein AAB654_18945 [Acidobacteriota bacterium]